MKHDPKYNTSLYNHSPICKDGRPLISNVEYRDLLDKVRGGDAGVYKAAKQIYNFEPAQEKLINDIINNTII
jgi:hypothetical protein